jgi:tetraacyldisaccharide 4'-kinase
MNHRIHPVTWLLFPLALIYYLIVVVRNRLFDANILKPVEFDIPVICVGNISVGGTGKTPHVEYLIELLSPKYKLAVLSRGYKRQSHGFQIITLDSSYREAGDESAQIKQKYPEILVAVDANRVEGIKKILHIDPGIQLILLDDAYQHRWVKPGLTILLVDWNRMIHNDRLLPMGRLREPASEKRRANLIVLTKCGEDLKPIDRRILLKEIGPDSNQLVSFSGMQYGDLKPVFPEMAPLLSLPKFTGTNPSVLLFTGIANPLPLQKYLGTFCNQVVTLRFPDHHNFSPTDLLQVIQRYEKIQGDNKYIITTEKDAVRLQRFKQLDEEIKQKMFFLPIKVKFLGQDGEDFNRYMMQYVSEFKRNRSVSAFAFQPKT